MALIGHAGHPGDRRDDGRGAGRHPPGRDGGRRRVAAPSADPRARRVRVPDDAVGRRDGVDRRRPATALSRRSSGRKTEDLCYATTNRQAAVKALAPPHAARAGDRLPQLVQFPAPRGDGSARGRRRRADRGRRADRPRLGSRRAGRRGHRGQPARPRTSPSAWSTGSARGARSVVEELALLRESIRFMLPRELRHAP